MCANERSKCPSPVRHAIFERECHICISHIWKVLPENRPAQALCAALRAWSRLSYVRTSECASSPTPQHPHPATHTVTHISSHALPPNSGLIIRRGYDLSTRFLRHCYSCFSNWQHQVLKADPDTIPCQAHRVADINLVICTTISPPVNPPHFHFLAIARRHTHALIWPHHFSNDVTSNSNMTSFRSNLEVVSNQRLGNTPPLGWLTHSSNVLYWHNMLSGVVDTPSPPTPFAEKLICDFCVNGAIANRKKTDQ